MKEQIEAVMDEAFDALSGAWSTDSVLVDWCTSVHDVKPELSRYNQPATEEQYRKYIAAGIQLLDSQRPGWKNRINWSALNLQIADTCFVGQLHDGDYITGLLALGIPPRDAWQYGFEALGHLYDDNDWAMLTRLWKEMAMPDGAPVEPEPIVWIILHPERSAPHDQAYHAWMMTQLSTVMYETN